MKTAIAYLKLRVKKLRAKIRSLEDQRKFVDSSGCPLSREELECYLEEYEMKFADLNTELAMCRQALEEVFTCSVYNDKGNSNEQ